MKIGILQIGFVFVFVFCRITEGGYRNFIFFVTLCLFNAF